MRRRDVSQADFVSFYEANRDACVRAVAVTVVDPDRAHDLVAEAFARAWANWSKVRVHPAPAAWVVRTARNVNVSSWRRRRREVPWSSTLDAAAHLDGASSIDPELLDALRKLSPRQREVVALRVFLDLDCRTTAMSLGIAEGTVTAHLARAVATLRASLAANAHQEVQP